MKVFAWNIFWVSDNIQTNEQCDAKIYNAINCHEPEFAQVKLHHSFHSSFSVNYWSELSSVDNTNNQTNWKINGITFTANFLPRCFSCEVYGLLPSLTCLVFHIKFLNWQIAVIKFLWHFLIKHLVGMKLQQLNDFSICDVNQIFVSTHVGNYLWTDDWRNVN